VSAGYVPTERAADAVRRADALVGEGRALEAIELLRSANRDQSDPGLERRLAIARYEAFRELPTDVGFDRWPVPVPELDTDGPARIPDLSPEELHPEAVRRQILSHGSVRVNGLFDQDLVAEFVGGIDRALEMRAEGVDSPRQQSTSWCNLLPVPPAEAQVLGRHWVAGSGGILTCDSPRMLFRLFEAYEEAGLRDVVTGYLGERPVLGANKCTLRRVPVTANTDWHQDGAFLGDGIRALNIWVALTDCGVDSPGIDLLPRRLDHVVETGTGGSIFDWAVGPAVVGDLAVDAPVVRPPFRAGDVLLFDELFLHRTAIEPTMVRPRYAVESWFFARSTYPDGQVPLVW
jgi:hypothetical protein